MEGKSTILTREDLIKHEKSQELEKLCKETIYKKYDRFRVIKKIGQGAFGCVFEVEDFDQYGNRRPRVAKIYFMDHIRKTFSNETVEMISNYIEREVDILDRFRHENIVSFYKYLTTENDTKRILIMKQYKEGNLYEYQERLPGSRFKEEQAIKFLRVLLSVLEELKAKNVIHRDIKPANIMIHNDAPVLIDFGCSKDQLIIALLGQKRETVNIGTMGYAAPEALLGQYSHAVDVFSVGMTAFYMISRIEPNFFEMETEGKYHTIEDYVLTQPHLSTIIKTFITRSIMKDPKSRATLDELKKILGTGNMPSQEEHRTQIRTYSDNQNFFDTVTNGQQLNYRNTTDVISSNPKEKEIPDSNSPF